MPTTLKPRSAKKARPVPASKPASPVAAGIVAASAQPDPGQMLNRVVAETAALVPNGVAAALLARPDSSRYTAVMFAGGKPLHIDEVVTIDSDSILRDSGERIPLLRGEGLTGPGGAGTAEGSAKKPSRKKGAAAPAVSVCIELCGRVIGELVLFDAPRKKAELTALVEQMAKLAASVAPAAAIVRAETVDTQLTELGAIVDVGQVLTGLLDMDDVLSYVVYLAESLVAGHSALVALLNEDGSEFTIHNATGTFRPFENEIVSIDRGILGWVVKNGTAAVLPDLPTNPHRFAFGEGFGPGVVVPILSVGRVIGAFMVARVPGSRAFPAESAAVLQQMAAYAAIAISNAQIHRQQVEVATALRKQATELEQAYGELNRSQEQLLIAEKMAALGRVTAGIAHEINSPLGGVSNSLMAVKGFIGEYQASIDDPDITSEDHRAIAEDMLNALGTAESALTKVAQFVKSIKSQTRAGEGGSTQFDPATEIDSTIVLLQHELKRRKVAVFTELDRGHKLTGDQGKFGVLIQNLISNAIDAYAGDPGEVWIRLKTVREDLIISVQDSGCGIPEEIRSRIFDYLFTTKDVGKGTGLGLAMVHSVVHTNFRGKIDLESEVGVGTTFTITIPLTQEPNHGA